MAPIPYIRTADGPDGRVRPIPAGVNYYATPAIRIVNPADAGQDWAVARADTDQFVQVEVGNLGTSAADDAAAGRLVVQFWGAGFGTASGFSASLGGPPGKQMAAPAVPAGSVSVPVQLPWRPQAAELGGAPERHFCIRANVFDAQIPGDKLADGSLVDVPAQLRHAQRNMTLKPQITNLKSFSFDLATANPDPEKPQEFELEIVPFAGKFQPAELAHIEESIWVERVEGERGLWLRGTEGRVAIKPASEGSVRRLRLELGKRAGQCLKLTYEPGAEHWITMRAIFDGNEDGLVHRFDIVQRGRDGVVGAARVMTIAVPEELTIPDFDDAEEGY